MLCPDCAAPESSRHVEGCDVARCSQCGWQRLTCDCTGGQPTVWTGNAPGLREVERHGYSNLNELYTEARAGRLSWDATAEAWSPSNQ